ncbi:MULTISPECIES: hypothetical protein [Kitasatospora]|uniref:Uncharacterized protein n=1 Tax=Kitasatospora setae (strain ATCC 33774 / DSM 43861 / JCM 3304 / KCC A-0304 / NBRC 14216 / KM-6054) TaxID=452652 RepID=E4NDA9_KITSK|nr:MULTISPECIES: hypothetical protein [Kitasatospora]BAJ29190.1 hypothetical protein KSE_33820 [Kitasatospora setae KM-6054]
MGNGELSGRESRQVAVAAATLGPWRTAATVGTVVGGAALAVEVFTLDWSLDILSFPVSLGLFVSFLVGTVGGRLRGGERRLRRWADAHPWQSVLPAAGALWGLDTLVLWLLGDHSLLGALFTALLPAAALLAVAGVVGSVKAARKG